jgi:hypothetical protein
MKTLLAIAVCFAMIGSAALCVAQTELVNDNFDSGMSGTPFGPNWTGCGFFLGTYNKLDYQNGQAGGGGYYSQECALYTGYGAFPSDQYATASVVAASPSSSTQAGLQLRQSVTPSAPESYIACGWNAQDFPADYHYRIWSMAPNPPTGGPSSLVLTNVTPVTNDVIWCQVLGTTVTMKVNGKVIATVTDNSGLTSGYPGLYYVDPSGGGPTSTDVIWDNFAAGAGPALVSLTITPNSTTATAGSYVQFSGSATYADGTVASISNWSSSDTTVAGIDSSGFAYAAAAGTVTVTGSTGVDSGTATLTVNATQGYTPLVHDSFVGSTGSYLGPNWSGCGYYGGAYSPLVYQNNQAGGGGYYSQECAVYNGTFPTDQYATATIVAPNPAATPQAGVQLRQNVTPSTPESYIACGWNAQDFAADYHYRIWSMQPDPPTGGPTSLYLSKVTPATNDVVWCQVMGTTVNMQVNGTTIATVTDDSGVTNGNPGLYYIDPNGDVPPPTDVIWDNFVAGQVDGKVITSIAVTPNPASVKAGSSVQFTATGTYTDGSTANITSSVTWSSSNTSVATVSPAGLASGVGGGSVTITGASENKTGGANLTVTVPTVPPTVSFTGSPASAAYGATFMVTATTNAPVMPTITSTSGVCSAGSVTGSPASANAIITMLAGTGKCTVTANWAAAIGYTAAGPLTQSTSATKVASTVTITSNTPNPSTLRQAVTIGFTVAGTGAGPTGSVTVTASTRESCTGTLNSAQTGSCSITFNTGGSRTLTAAYGGSSNFNSSTSASVSQTVNSPTVSLSPTSLSFGTVTRNTNLTKAETVSNTGSGALLNLSWSITGPDSNRFSVSSTTCGTTLNPGSSCVINVTFRPNNTGSYSANLNLTDNANNSPQTVALTGNGR